MKIETRHVLELIQNDHQAKRGKRGMRGGEGRVKELERVLK
jgi:hypothetical protein